MHTTQSQELPLIGRAHEQEELSRALESGRPELIAVYGRRRVGKTYLIRKFFANQLSFELTGARDVRQRDQLRNFAQSLQKATGFKLRPPRDWVEAFQDLIHYLTSQLTGEARRVVFFDELPWLDGRRSGFLTAFEHFWNTWGSMQKGLVVVVCGSAASWMVAKIIRQKGGLHNRITLSIPLQPFRLPDIDAYLKARGIVLDHKQTTELAMATGGVPYYLNHVRKGFSAAQNIDALFFAQTAPLRDEFNNLFASLFDNHERHLKVIRALAKKNSGLVRQELIEKTDIQKGGTLSGILDELESSGFIHRMIPFGRKQRDARFRLIDEMTLFHIRWIEGRRDIGSGDRQWVKTRSTPAWVAWSGYAFENMCLKHADQIKKALGIAAVQTECSSWFHRAVDKNDTGAQIDLLIDRRDGVISVCEMKYSENEFVIDKSYAQELRSKLAVFKSVTGAKKSIMLALVTTYGVKKNDYEAELVQSSVTVDALFSK